MCAEILNGHRGCIVCQSAIRNDSSAILTAGKAFGVFRGSMQERGASLGSSEI